MVMVIRTAVPVVMFPPSPVAAHPRAAVIGTVAAACIAVTIARGITRAIIFTGALAKLPRPSLSTTSSAHVICLRRPRVVFVLDPAAASWAPRRRRMSGSGEADRDEAESTGVTVWVAEPEVARREGEAACKAGARCLAPVGLDGLWDGLMAGGGIDGAADEDMVDQGQRQEGFRDTICRSPKTNELFSNVLGPSGIISNLQSHALERTVSALHPWPPAALDSADAVVLVPLSNRWLVSRPSRECPREVSQAML
ncbi:hypothetical protein CLAIMM_04009 [Cladophialophora immunda]|nr:hypothetical protein CLAIMM_04009 [Cladophialophora immunda]